MPSRSRELRPKIRECHSELPWSGLNRELTKPEQWWKPDPTEAPGSFAQVLENLKPGGGEKLVVPPHHEGLHRLAWHICRKQFAGVSIPFLNKKGVVSLIVKALKRQYEKAAIEEGIQNAIENWRFYSPLLATRYEVASYHYQHVRWLHKDLKNSCDDGQRKELLGFAHFMKKLQSNLEYAFQPPIIVLAAVSA